MSERIELTFGKTLALLFSQNHLAKAPTQGWGGSDAATRTPARPVKPLGKLFLKN
jgi:hypothetical protein